MEAGSATDAVVARSLEESARLWRIRECAGELLPQLLPVGVYDVSLPIARMDAYLEEIRARLEPLLAGRPFFVFGHLGDGNLHIAAAVATPADVVAAAKVVLANVVDSLDD